MSSLVFSSSSSDAFDLHYAVVIFRLRAGFDATEKEDEKGSGANGGPHTHTHTHTHTYTHTYTHACVSLTTCVRTTIPLLPFQTERRNTPTPPMVHVAVGAGYILNDAHRPLLEGNAPENFTGEKNFVCLLIQI